VQDVKIEMNIILDVVDRVIVTAPNGDVIIMGTQMSYETAGIYITAAGIGVVMISTHIIFKLYQMMLLR